MAQLTHKQCGSSVKVISGIFTKNPSVKCTTCNLIIPLASDSIGKFHPTGNGSDDCTCEGCISKRLLDSAPNFGHERVCFVITSHIGLVSH